MPIGTTISFDSKGALDLLAITKEITLLPGIYRFEADAKYNDFHDANLHIRSNHRKLPSLQWSGSDKNPNMKIYQLNFDYKMCGGDITIFSWVRWMTEIENVAMKLHKVA